MKALPLRVNAFGKSTCYRRLACRPVLLSAFCTARIDMGVGDNRMNRVVHVWEQRNGWDTIIREHPEKEETQFVSA
ncbi:MAG: hypothetical protein ACLR6J_13075 [Parabacteroides merdae]